MRAVVDGHHNKHVTGQVQGPSVMPLGVMEVIQHPPRHAELQGVPLSCVCLPPAGANGLLCIGQ